LRARHPRATDLAAEFVVGVGAVSKAVDRLEARGLVTRLPNPANRRSTILALTDEGRALIDAADTTFQRRLAEILADAAAPERIAPPGCSRPRQLRQPRAASGLAR
jgi:MarR family transcriptional regulator, multiple antibiotic resistance protein MarR